MNRQTSHLPTQGQGIYKPPERTFSPLHRKALHSHVSSPLTPSDLSKVTALITLIPKATQEPMHSCYLHFREWYEHGQHIHWDAQSLGLGKISSSFLLKALWYLKTRQFHTKGSQDRNSNRARNLEAGVDEETIDRGCYLLVWLSI